jgi:hypothetical protein
VDTVRGKVGISVVHRIVGAVSAQPEIRRPMVWQRSTVIKRVAHDPVARPGASWRDQSKIETASKPLMDALAAAALYQFSPGTPSSFRPTLTTVNRGEAHLQTGARACHVVRRPRFAGLARRRRIEVPRYRTMKGTSRGKAWCRTINNWRRRLRQKTGKRDGKWPIGKGGSFGKEEKPLIGFGTDDGVL